MNSVVDVVLLPHDLKPPLLLGRAAVVFDVLRATTTIASAFATGITEIHAFANLDEMKRAAGGATPKPITCGEQHALPAPGVDLGNSPRQWTPQHAGKTVYLCTTNGTVAMAAAKTAAVMFAGSLVNASATAHAVAQIGKDAILICSGTNGQIALEDALGAGAVCQKLIDAGYTAASDTARIVQRLFNSTRESLVAALHDCQGGRNVKAAGLEPDIEFAARLDAVPVLCRIDPLTLIIRPIAMAGVV